MLCKDAFALSFGDGGEEGLDLPIMGSFINGRDGVSKWSCHRHALSGMLMRCTGCRLESRRGYFWSGWLGCPRRITHRCGSAQGVNPTLM